MVHARLRGHAAGREEPLRALLPLELYELGASRLGFLPEPFAFSVRAFAALRRRLLEGERFDLIHDVQCLGYGIWGLHASACRW